MSPSTGPGAARSVKAWLDRRPGVALALGAAIVAVVFGGLALAFAGQGSDPRSEESRATGDRVFRLRLPPVRRAPATVPEPKSPPAAGARGPRLAEMIGQQIMVGVAGARPTAALLRRVRLGQVGGVIILGRRSAAQVAALSAQLQAAARAGGRPGLLVSTDQEGGTVKRIVGPPYRSAAELGAAGASSARSEAERTATLLRRARVNVDLAPVADVATGPSFLGTRTFGGSSARVASAASAFAAGLQEGGIAATAKHFPGLGSTGAENTDLGAVSAPKVTAAQLHPFRALVRGEISLVMVSSASYRGLGPRPAVLSAAIVSGLLRHSLGFHGVVISDDLSSPALAPYGSRAPGLAVGAGVDVLLHASTDTGRPFEDLLADVKSGRLSRTAVARSYGRILELKARLGLVAAIR